MRAGTQSAVWRSALKTERAPLSATAAYLGTLDSFRI
jgi:hypothetical protein